MATQDPVDWVTRAADDAIRHHERTGADGPVTCSSGISPSGPVHLGNLREFLMPHFVADELRRRGVPVRHLHVWDDYDRFRKVPYGVDPSLAEHIGRPLVAVPDPWECHASWPSTTRSRSCGARMRWAPRWRRSPRPSATGGRLPRGGAARRSTPRRDRRRARAAPHQEGGAPPRGPRRRARRPGGGGDGRLGRERRGRRRRERVGYFPFKPYCHDCGRDTTTVTAYDDDTTDLAYTCSVCDYHGTTNLATQDEGKLVWKADWPMRWAFEQVDFEPAGMDHATPGSSFTVGHELVESIWDYPRPAWFGYGFVGFAGVQKMSSSAGGAPTAEDALRVLEPSNPAVALRPAPAPADLRHRLRPRGRAAVRRVGRAGPQGRRPRKRDAQVLAYERAAATDSSGPLPRPRVVVPFRMLASVADVTAGSAEQISRIVSHLGHAHDSVDDLEPRLSRAMAWTAEFVPAADRTTVRSEPDAAAIEPRCRTGAGVGGSAARGARSPRRARARARTGDRAGVRRTEAGAGPRPRRQPTDEVKADQKEFFRLLYHLLVDAERGPRLPTLIVALGTDRVRTLLGG